jgi:hypothetical protein
VVDSVQINVGMIYLDDGDLYDKLFILLNTMIRKYNSFLNSLQLSSFSYDAIQIPLHMFLILNTSYSSQLH